MKIYRNEAQIEKICRILENLRKTFFLPEKNPTSSFKIGGVLKKIVKFPIGSRHFFPRKKGSLIFMKIYRNEVQIEKICRILENLRKTFFYWKKILLQVEKSGVFSDKKCSLIFMKIYRNEVQAEKICRILENLRKTFFYRKKIQLQV